VRLASESGPLRQFILAHPKLLILNAGCLLPYINICRSGRSGGNVGIAQRFPRSGGKGGKPAFGFPGFPSLVISTA
jgi:hypothetical protein